MASKQRLRDVPAGSREFRSYVSNAREINWRYAGKHVAIIGDRVVASGKSPMEVWKRAKRSHPQSRPFLAYVPKPDAIVLGRGSVLDLAGVLSARQAADLRSTLREIRSRSKSRKSYFGVSRGIGPFTSGDEMKVHH